MIELINELIHELCKMEFEELLDFKKEWVTELENTVADKRVQALCIKIIEAVIANKKSKVA